MAFTSLAARQSKSTEVKATCVGEGRSVLKGAWHSVSCVCALPYDLLSVNKELKSIGLHFVFSIFSCLPSLPLSLCLSPSAFVLCFSLCISLSLHSIFTAHWFHFCTQQFRNKISPRCKLKLQCNWLIHAYITSAVAPLPSALTVRIRISQPEEVCAVFSWISLRFWSRRQQFQFNSDLLKVHCLFCCASNIIYLFSSE